MINMIERDFQCARQYGRLKHFIGNKYLEVANDKYFPSCDSSISKVITEVPEIQKEDVELVMRSAASAFEKWSNTQYLNKCMKNLRELLEQLRVIPEKKVQIFKDRYKEQILKTKMIPLRKLISEISEVVIAYMDLEQSVFSDKISHGKKMELIRRALNLGYNTALEVSKNYSTNDPVRLARDLNAKVELLSSPCIYNQLIIFSEYNLKSSTIYVYEGSIDYEFELASLHGLDKIFQKNVLISLHIAHELFHHITEKAWKNRREEFLIEIFKIGPIKMRAKIQALYDIAADSFAYNLLGLKYSQRLLDYFLTGDPQRIYKIIKELNEMLTKKDT
jgi:hypothetical protein